MLDLSQFEGHTPGPWLRGDNGGIRQTDGIFAYVRYSSPWVEGAWSDADASPETIANDRLMAAAPELLAEVKRLRAVLHLIPDNPPVTGQPKVSLAKSANPS